MKNIKGSKTFNGYLMTTALLLLLICIGCLSCIGANKTLLSAKADMHEDIYAGNVVFENFGYLSHEEKRFRNENPDATANEVVAFLDDLIIKLNGDGQTRNVLNSNEDDGDENYDYDGQYEIFGKTITDAEIKLVAAYPSQAVIAFNASEDARIAAKNYYEEGLYLGNGDALRHAYWNALMEKRISKDYYVDLGTAEFPNWTVIHIDFAKEFADAHESATPEGVDLEMDLRNNAIGRADGENFSDFSDDQLSFEIMRRISYGNYWKIINHYKIDDVVYGELVSSDWKDLKSVYFEQVMFDSTLVEQDKIRLDKVNWQIEGDYVIPDTLNGKTVMEIGEGAFLNQNKITSLVLPNFGVTIGRDAFNGCTSLESVTIPDSVTGIGSGAFNGCTSLESIRIPDSVTEIGSGAFVGCGNLQIEVPDTNPNFSVENNILYNKEKTKIVATGKIEPIQTIPETITEIDAYAFAGNSNLQEVRMTSLPVIQEFAFGDCSSLKKVTIDSYDSPNFASNAFDESNCVIYVPYIMRGIYGGIMTSIDVSIDTEKLNVAFCDRGEPFEEREYYYGGYMEELPLPTRKGYAFSGWYDEAGVEYTANTLLKEKSDLGLYAEWELQQYNALLNANGGTVSPDEVLFTVEEGVDLPIPERVGYNFAGWYDNADFEGEPMYRIEKGTAGNLHLTAKWEPKEIEIELRCCDEHAGKIVKVVYGALNDLSEYSPEFHEGKIFDGWSKDGTLYFDKNGQAFRPWQIEDSVTLTAQWIEAYYIKIVEEEDGQQSIYWVNKDGEIKSDMSIAGIPLGTQFTDVTMLIDVFKVAPRQFYDGRYFKTFTWEYVKAEENYQDREVTSIQGESGTVLTIYPYYALESYSIKLYDRDGEHNEPFMSIAYGTSLYSDVINFSYDNLFGSKTGYEFVKWVVKTPDPGTFLPAHEDKFPVGSEFNYERMPDLSPAIEESGNALFLQAVLEAKTVVVSFDAANGVNYPDMTIKYDAENMKFPVPVLWGYNFKGWYDGVGGTGKQYSDETGRQIGSWDKETDTTLYARWEAKEFNITYNYDGDKSGFPTTYTYGVQLTLPSAYKDYYDFDGWKSSLDGAVIRVISVGTYGDITLTAQFTGCIYFIRYVSNGRNDDVVYPTTQYTYSIGVTLGAPSRTTDFIGYYSDQGLKNRITRIDETTHGNVTVYVKWNNAWIGSQYRTYPLTITDKGDYSQYDEADVFLRGYGYGDSYSKVHFVIRLTLYEEDDGYQKVALCYDSSGQSVVNGCAVEFEHTHGKKDGSTREYTFEFYIDTSVLMTTDVIYICYGARGALGDDWVTTTMEAEMYLIE